jgi:GNAT superfamily N-acetyltransferase
MSLSFELACLDDAAILIEVQDQSFYDDFVRFGECPGYHVSLDDMKQRILKPFMYKILLEGRIIGNITVRIRDEGRYWLGCLAIIPEFQNRGIGSKALQFIEKEFPDAISWSLDTPVQKASNCHFYEKAGYVGVEDKVHSEKVTLRIYEKNMKCYIIQ